MKRLEEFSRATRGAVVPAPKGKTRITIRIDDDILDWFRNQVDSAGGVARDGLLARSGEKHSQRHREDGAGAEPDHG